MKHLLSFAITLGALVGPALCSAQSTAPVTRAEVRADLIRWEQAGYAPALGNDPHYPADAQAAEARIAAADNTRLTHDAVGGTSLSGTSASGARVHTRPATSSPCVGPVSFCTPYFGS